MVDTVNCTTAASFRSASAPENGPALNIGRGVLPRPSIGFRPHSRTAINDAVALLPAIDDARTAAVVEALCVAVVDLSEQLDAVRAAYLEAVRLLPLARPTRRCEVAA